MYNTITDPYTNIAYSINSKKGVNILKKFIKFSASAGSINAMSGGDGTPMVLAPDSFSCECNNAKCSCTSKSNIVPPACSQYVVEAAEVLSEREVLKMKLKRAERTIHRQQTTIDDLEQRHDGDAAQIDAEHSAAEQSKTAERAAHDEAAAAHAESELALAEVGAAHTKAEEARKQATSALAAAKAAREKAEADRAEMEKAKVAATTAKAAAEKEHADAVAAGNAEAAATAAAAKAKAALALANQEAKLNSHLLEVAAAKAAVAEKEATASVADAEAARRETALTNANVEKERAHADALQAQLNVLKGPLGQLNALTSNLTAALEGLGIDLDGFTLGLNIPDSTHESRTDIYYVTIARKSPPTTPSILVKSNTKGSIEREVVALEVFHSPYSEEITGSVVVYYYADEGEAPKYHNLLNQDGTVSGALVNDQVHKEHIKKIFDDTKAKLQSTPKLE